MSALVKELYRSEIESGDDGSVYLDNDINFTEFEIAILVYATNMKVSLTCDIRYDKDGNTFRYYI